MSVSNFESAYEASLPDHRHYGIGLALSPVRRALIASATADNVSASTRVSLPLFRRDQTLWFARDNDSFARDSRYDQVQAVVRPIEVAPGAVMKNFGLELVFEDSTFKNLYFARQYHTEMLAEPSDRIHLWFGALSAAGTVCMGENLESHTLLDRQTVYNLAQTPLIANALT